jgi:dimethylsulfone monooxygenase
VNPEIGKGQRAAMGSTNRLKLGLFGANCSSGRAVTTVPERWSGNWPDCIRLAQTADRAGIEFMLPIGRWKGYGGDTDYQGATWETVAWACGLLAKTERLTVFGTVHAALLPPLIAAKEFVTADHIGEGRFGLNVVCGWNEGEFDMFGGRCAITRRATNTRRNGSILSNWLGHRTRISISMGISSN